MKTNKSLLKMVERAEVKGEAVKRIRECDMMSMSQYYAFRTYNRRDVPFVEQWRVVYKEGFVKVFHYDTLIFHADKTPGGWALVYYYGESNTDRDALNTLCDHFNLEQRFAYGSKKGFVLC